jgi:glycosidase
MLYNGQEVGTPYRLTFPFTSTKIDWTLNPELKAEYKKLITFRNRSAAIRRAEPVSFTTDDVCAFTKLDGKEQVFVLVNVRNKPVTYPLPPATGGNWKDAFTGKRVKLARSTLLQPYQYLVLVK